MASASSMMSNSVPTVCDRVRTTDDATTIENNLDYENVEIMIDTDTGTIYDNGMVDAGVMDGNETCSVGQKKRKQRNSAIVVVADGDVDCDSINGAMYKIVQRNGKRQKIEVLTDNGVCQGDIRGQGAAGATNNKNKENVKPPVPPKPKHLVCRPPAVFKEPKIGTKFEQIHTLTVQKLNAHAQQLRQEINHLKTALTNEQTAVRTLR